MKRVGIIGGGQLGLMLAQALVELGAVVSIFDPDAEAPARRTCGLFTKASFSDVAALTSFFDQNEVVTFEFENLDANALAAVSSRTPLWPSVEVLRTAQDRVLEKRFLVDQGVPVVRHAWAPKPGDQAAALQYVGFPLIAKTARGGYDGKGQVTLRSAAGSVADLAALAEVPGGWIFEERVNIVREVSCIVARGADGEEQLFPIFENLHRDHILDTTIVPARVEPAMAEQAGQIAIKLARGLGVVGLLTVEFFITDRGLFVNELAPRPHNSGHVTRRATRFSQFSALARVLCGVPIGKPVLRSNSVWAMGNLLGEVWPKQPGAPLGLTPWAAFPTVAEVYLYGKRIPADKRKMGHFLVEEPTAEAAEQTVQDFRAALRRG